MNWIYKSVYIEYYHFKINWLYIKKKEIKINFYLIYEPIIPMNIIDLLLHVSIKIFLNIYVRSQIYYAYKNT